MNNNTIEFKISGKYALFTDPLTKLGGEKCSYHIPTYEALKGITKNIYWKPTFIWIIDKVRIMNKIRTQPKGIKTIKYSEGGNDISIYTYLVDVSYQIQAHFEWNYFQKNLEQDRNYNKHMESFNRHLKRGGKLPICLGVSECKADVVPCEFGSGKSYYDNDSDELTFGRMYHSICYPNEYGNNKVITKSWNPKMKNGIIEFIRPEKCTSKFIYNSMYSEYIFNKNIKSVDGELDELGQ